MSLKLGHIDYLNCVPLFHYLRNCGFDGEIVKGVPSTLNAMLARGEIDVSPSSSFEYGRSFTAYKLLPGYSISAFGPVQSVMLFSHVPVDELRGHRIYITGESATSVNLLRVLLREYYGWDQVDTCVPDVPVEEMLAQGRAVLLIGDRALRLALASQPTVRYRYDLASLWRQFTAMPFVFALWIVRNDVVDGKLASLQRLRQHLAASYARARAELPELAATVSRNSWISADQLLDYWRCMSYELDEAHLAGLELFFELCVKYGYLKRRPKVEFVD